MRLGGLQPSRRRCTLVFICKQFNEARGGSADGGSPGLVGAPSWTLENVTDDPCLCGSGFKCRISSVGLMV